MVAARDPNQRSFTQDTRTVIENDLVTDELGVDLASQNVMYEEYSRVSATSQKRWKVQFSTTISVRTDAVIIIVAINVSIPIRIQNELSLNAF